MSDTEQKSETTVRSRRRRRRPIRAGVDLCVLALFAALTIWAARPRWYTYVSRPTTSRPHYALELRVPVGCECIGMGGSSNSVNIEIRRTPVVGLARWLNHLLHRDPQPQLNDRYILGLATIDMSAKPEEGACVPSDVPEVFIHNLKQSDQRHSNPFVHDLYETFEHPMGPAIIWKSAHKLPVKISAQLAECEDTTIVLRRRPKRHPVIAGGAHFHFGSIVGSSLTPSTWNEIVRSIRVVQK